MAYNTHPGIASGELVKAQDIREMDEQIYENTQDIEEINAELTSQSSRIATKAEKSALASTDREVSLLRKAIEGQLMEIENDSTEAYSKALPSNTLGVLVNSIGGKSVVWNQKVDVDDVNVSATGTIVKTGNKVTYTVVSKSTASTAGIYIDGVSVTNPHAYLMRAKIKNNTSGTIEAGFMINTNAINTMQEISAGETLDMFYLWKPASSSDNFTYRIRFSTTDDVAVGETIEVEDWTCVDVTDAGDNPETVDEVAPWIKSYLTAHPEFGHYILSADCDAVVSQGKNLFNQSTIIGASGITFADGVFSGLNTAFRTFFISNPISGIFKQNTRYAVSARIVASDGNNTRFYFQYTDGTKSFVPFAVGAWSEISESEKTVELIGFDYGSSGNLQIADIQIEESSSATSYSPYMSDSFPIPQGLREDYPMRSAGNAYDSMTFTKPSPTAPWKVEHHGKTMKKIISSSDISLARDYTSIRYYRMSKVGAGIGHVGYPIICDKAEYNSATTDWNDSQKIGKVFDGASISEWWFGFSLETTLEQATAALTGGTIIYPNNETVTDVTSYFNDGFSPLLNAEAGGSLTFHQTSTEFPLPNSTDYFVKTSPSVTTE